MKIEGISNNKTTSVWDRYADYRDAMQQNRQGNAPGGLAAEGTQESAATKRVDQSGGCETCENRKYQDGSDDPGVSFKTPTKLSPEQAAASVRGHEMEHVGREQGKAARENREVVSQSVTYHTAICSECGRAYVSGGTTRTVTRGKQEAGGQPETGAKPEAVGLDTYI